jgi:hypothetical protein
MWMQLFSDLRFMIGLYFGIISIILTGIGIFQNIPVNLMAGAYLGVFSASMIGLAVWAFLAPKPCKDETIS